MHNMIVYDHLSSLPSLSRNELSSFWRKLFTADPPRKMRKELMLRVIAYRMQELEFGGLRESYAGRLRELGDEIETNSKTAAAGRKAIKAGTRLIREWNNQLHIVNVEERNFEYRGSHYESLSEIARFITGTRWSGPLFFGLKARTKDMRKAV
jgi:hypothetical protein